MHCSTLFSNTYPTYIDTQLCRSELAEMEEVLAGYRCGLGTEYVNGRCESMTETVSEPAEQVLIGYICVLLFFPLEC